MDRSSETEDIFPYSGLGEGSITILGDFRSRIFDLKSVRMARV